MSKIVSKRRQIGVIGLIVSIVMTISIFAYFSLYSNMNWGHVGNSLSTSHDMVSHSNSNTSEINLDDGTSSMLVAVWIGLMILGSYLLFHIHFKVLPKE